MNEFFLLVLGLAGCWAIGALNKNVRLGLYLFAALLTGFVGGEVYRVLTSDKTDDTDCTIQKQVVNGSNESTVLFPNSFVNYEMTPPEILSQVHLNRDTQLAHYSHQQRVTLGHGLSPPALIDSS